MSQRTPRKSTEGVDHSSEQTFQKSEFPKFQDWFESVLSSQIDWKVSKVESKLHFKHQNYEKTKKTINLRRKTMIFSTKILILETSGSVFWLEHWIWGLLYNLWNPELDQEYLDSGAGFWVNTRAHSTSLIYSFRNDRFIALSAFLSSQSRNRDSTKDKNRIWKVFGNDWK